jgi:hypothetical protein
MAQIESALNDAKVIALCVFSFLLASDWANLEIGVFATRSNGFNQDGSELITLTRRRLTIYHPPNHEPVFQSEMVTYYQDARAIGTLIIAVRADNDIDLLHPGERTSITKLVSDHRRVAGMVISNDSRLFIGLMETAISALLTCRANVRYLESTGKFLRGSLVAGAGPLVGGVEYPAVTTAIRRFEKGLQADKKLADRLNHVLKMLQVKT